MAEKIYLGGFMAFPPKQGRPDFVLGSGAINIKELKAWLDSEEVKKCTVMYESEPEIIIEINRRKDGKLSIVIDTYNINKE